MGKNQRKEFIKAFPGMFEDKNELVEINADIKRDLERSYVLDVHISGEGPRAIKTVCVGKSVCNQIDNGVFEIPMWLAEKEGLL